MALTVLSSCSQPPKAHAIRLAFQSVLLAMLWEMATPTLIDAQYNLGLM